LHFHFNAHIIVPMQGEAARPRSEFILRMIVPLAAALAIAAWIYIAPPGLLGKLDAVGYAVCHRLDSHSLHIGNTQLPLCARCTGEFNAAFIGLVFQGLVSRKRSKLPVRGILWTLVLFFLAFAIDGSNSYLALLKQSYSGPFDSIPNLYTTDNTLRVLTGSGMGIAMAAFLFPMYNQTIWSQPEDERALNWKQFGILVGIVLLFDIGMLSGSPWILYPVAFISTFGVLLLLSMVFSVSWITIMRQDNSFQKLAQLWLPALAGLTLAFILILGIDLFRFNLTHTWSGFPGMHG
jgi:uncharacterized membrane protein